MLYNFWLESQWQIQGEGLGGGYQIRPEGFFAFTIIHRKTSPGYTEMHFSELEISTPHKSNTPNWRGVTSSAPHAYPEHGYATPCDKRSAPFSNNCTSKNSPSTSHFRENPGTPLSKIPGSASESIYPESLTLKLFFSVFDGLM